MKYASAVLISLTVLFSGVVTPLTDVSAPAPVVAAPVAAAPIEEPQQAPTAPRFGVHTADPVGLELAEWARNRYQAAGLELPDVDIWFHSDWEACGRNQALARNTATGYELHICSLVRSYRTEDLLLHELAHAWTAANLTDTQRHDLLELRGVDVWHDTATKWEERGIEHAAVIIAWGLHETSRRSDDIDNHDLESFTEAYRLLTGSDPITDTSREWDPRKTATKATTTITQGPTTASGRVPA